VLEVIIIPKHIYQPLSRSSYTDLDYGSYCLSELELGLTARVTGQQGMFTPPMHLIPPLAYPEVRVCLIFKFFFPAELMRLMTDLYLYVVSYTISSELQYGPPSRTKVRSSSSDDRSHPLWACSRNWAYGISRHQL
jgi:hypothetical protein